MLNPSFLAQCPRSFFKAVVTLASLSPTGGLGRGRESKVFRPRRSKARVSCGCKSRVKTKPPSSKILRTRSSSSRVAKSPFTQHASYLTDYFAFFRRRLRLTLVGRSLQGPRSRRYDQPQSSSRRPSRRRQGTSRARSLRRVCLAEIFLSGCLTDRSCCFDRVKMRSNGRDYVVATFLDIPARNTCVLQRGDELEMLPAGQHYVTGANVGRIATVELLSVRTMLTARSFCRSRSEDGSPRAKHNLRCRLRVSVL